jgi:hypothetical protein
MEDVGIFYGHLVYFTAILVYFTAVWYIFGYLVYFWLFGIFLVIWYIFNVLASCTKKNLATLALTANLFTFFEDY